MQTHVVQLTKQRLSDFFVKEDGHVAHKNALVAGTVATGAILASLMLTPDAAACTQTTCENGLVCSVDDGCCTEWTIWGKKFSVVIKVGSHLEIRWLST